MEEQRRKLILILKRNGLLGNRLARAAHLLAFSKAHGHMLVDFSFYDYARYFPSTRVDFFCRYPSVETRWTSVLSRKVIYKGARTLVKLMNRARVLEERAHHLGVRRFSLATKQRIELSDDRFAKALSEADVLLLEGFLYQDFENLKTYAEDVRRHFRPFPHVEHRVETLLRRARQGVDVLIGVHMRQGEDYKTWECGRWHYPTEAYLQVMQRVQAAFPNRRIGFLVCSDQPIDKDCLMRLPHSVESGSGDVVEDLYSLAGCDFLIGTHSTFAMWSSFYGQCPYYKIEDPAAAFGPDAFQRLLPQ